MYWHFFSCPFNMFFGNILIYVSLASAGINRSIMEGADKLRDRVNKEMARMKSTKYEKVRERGVPNWFFEVKNGRYICLYEVRMSCAKTDIYVPSKVR